MRRKSRQLFLAVTRTVYEYGVFQALGPMFLAGVAAMAIIFVGIATDSGPFITVGSVVGYVVAGWAVFALCFAIIFNRWIS